MTKPSVILITDPKWPVAHIGRVIEAAATAIDPERLLVQLRDKTSSDDEVAENARSLHAITQRVGARFVINGRVALARDLGVDGVHVACDAAAIAKTRAIFGGDAWISTPAHTDDEVAIAASAGATAVLVSPIWETPHKGSPRGPQALATARAASASRAISIYALGGVDTSRALLARDAGADGVAVIRALLEAEDPAAVARVLDAPFHD